LDVSKYPDREIAGHEGLSLVKSSKGNSVPLVMNAEIERLPNLHLNTIEKFKYFPVNSNGAFRAYEILPDAYFDLAFLLSDADCKIMIAGPWTEKTITSLGNYELFVVRFKVGRLPRLLDVKTSDLVNSMIQIPRLFGVTGDEICEQLLAQKEVCSKQKFIEKLFALINLQPAMDNRIYVQSTEIIESCGGQIQVAELAKLLDVSTRSLERIYADVLGISPKKIIRLIRFQNVLAKLKSSKQYRNYSEIAYESGFSDQSHFVQEIKALAGVLPSDL